MVTVKEILQAKDPGVWTIAPNVEVFEALKVMADKNVGALIVVENDRVVGIMSERDYARKIALLGKLSQNTPVRDIMTSEVYVVPPEATADECIVLMTEKRIRHLPVIAADKLVGVVSIGDIVKTIISHQQGVIEHLENYITGKYL